MSRPNILLIVTTRQHFALAEQAAMMPNLAALAQGGVRYDGSYTCATASSSSRASILTGCYPTSHGLWADGITLPSHNRLIGRVLGNAGYDCGHVGRLHLAPCENAQTEIRGNDGFTSFDWSHGPTNLSRQNSFAGWLKEADPKTYATVFSREFDVTRPDGTWSPEAGRTQVEAAAQLAHLDWAAERAIAFVTAPRACPYFLSLGISAPEIVATTPGDTTPEPAVLERLDIAIGKVLAETDENTLVIVTSDRGPGLPPHNTAIRVPLVLHWPANPRATACVRTEPVQSIDIAATIAEAARVGSIGQGLSLLGDRARSYALIWSGRSIILCEDGWKLVLTGTRARLFDLGADPEETTDLAQTHAYAARLEDMTDRMIEHLMETEDRSARREANW
ncbi:MAG: sulfatase-like hydrolase/transferase [Hyphomicrobiaceae bacterium]